MQLEFFDVPSPCIGVCQTDDKGYCLGCMRTREERQGWLSLSCADRQKVIKRCRQRKRRRDNANKPKMPAEEVVIVQHSLLDPPDNADLDSSNLNRNKSEQEISKSALPENNAHDKSREKQTAQDNQLAIENDMDFSDFEL
ncbi:DUF1289 domain-containing protein [Thalassomonas actiniarum]|uniref:DUF1289 domain-containing protein n=1 Tax=Thalassomonas actiniarum TaxID=485447 RepID=A0AAE9YS86_9GAMM|nr:DUF1289 domain-containing protein [Thalassomonas actiniarum]